MTIDENTTAPAATAAPGEGYHLARMLAHSAERFDQLPAYRTQGADGSWQTTSYRDFHAQTQQMACALVGLGLQPGDRVAIFSANRPEWSITDFGTLAAGGIVVPIFAASSAHEVRHVLDDSGARIVFVGSAREAEVLGRALAGASEAFTVVGFDEIDGLDSFERVMAGADLSLLPEVEARTVAGSASDIATIVYTSGTTGRSKGAMLTHGGFGQQSEAIDDCWDFRPGDQSLCFLPLAHSLERLWTFHVYRSGCLNTYCTVPKQVAHLLAKARPNLLVSVPMLFEKIMAGAKEQASSPVAARTMRWALRVGGQCQRAHRKGKRPHLWWRSQLPLADKLVLSKIRGAVGGNKKLMVSGGAPLRREVEEFFSAAGILLGQGYGLTEAGPMMTIYRPDHYKLGTVGFCIKGGELGIGAGGEVLVRGGSVMKGYWNQPEATAEAIDADGWLHTGDVGYVDPDGFVTITDRMKDLIVTANGKNVAPQAVEAALMADPLFEQAVVVGDARPCLVAILQPSPQGWEQIAVELGLEGLPPEQLAVEPRVREHLRERAAVLTQDLAHHEQVRDVVLSHGRITMASGLVTATMKVRRRLVGKEFATEVAETYRELAERRRRS
ncbi:AMP-dependent synthetase/ligase [Luteococcus sp.]|uniref:AMP-dependent synthetase/ligase n=1 Tax=Luteococcus sp. TaxID=1969402 RepID=UPI003736AE40